MIKITEIHPDSAWCDNAADLTKDTLVFNLGDLVPHCSPGYDPTFTTGEIFPANEETCEYFESLNNGLKVTTKTPLFIFGFKYKEIDEVPVGQDC